MYPTLDEVRKADREQICRWYRFLPSDSKGNDPAIMARIVKRFNDFGGFTPEISKRVGWDP